MKVFLITAAALGWVWLVFGEGKFFRLSSDLLAGDHSKVLFSSMVDDKGKQFFVDCYRTCLPDFNCNLFTWGFEGQHCHHVKGIPAKNETPSDSISIKKPEFFYVSAGFK